MIKSVHIFSENNSKKCDFTQASLNRIELSNNWLKKESFSIQIEFKNKIVSFRNHDYQWVKIDKKRIANWYAPKIIRLDNDQLVQANQNLGIWEVNNKKPNTLLWHFNPKNAKPIINYDANNHKHIIQSITKNVFKESLALLFPSQHGIEVSRSKIPFSAIVKLTFKISALLALSVSICLPELLTLNAAPLVFNTVKTDPFSTVLDNSEF